MKTKIITAIIAFAATFLSSAALTGLLVGKRVLPVSTVYRTVSAQTQKRILILLRQDISNGEKRDNALFQTEYYRQPLSAVSVGVYAEVIGEYQTKSASINDTDLPQDFQSAWRQHMKAWRDHSVFLDQLKQSAETQSMTAQEIAGRLNDRDDAINRTWYKVLRIASKYNANPYEVE